jgi:hypothetical protein
LILNFGVFFYVTVNVPVIVLVVVAAITQL